MDNIAPNDNGYISDYLIHWTGNKSDEEGSRILSTIVTDRELLLSYNTIHAFDWSRKIKEKMVCFTDVPLCKSQDHCQKYGRFGIAFKKLALMNVGAQPVFYVSHVSRRYMNTIFDFLHQQHADPTIDQDVFKALRYHFYFMQTLSAERADAHDAFYYEREWRLGAQSLPTREEWDRPNPKAACMKEGYPPYLGKRKKHDGKEYFSFDPENVAFLVVPESHEATIKNPHGFQIYTFESLINAIDKEA